jgi:hypothetical protein
LAEQDQREGVGRVHLGVGHKAQFF